MKPKVAFYWCASCGGCEEAVLDLYEDLLAVLDAIEIVFWPVALDFKEHDFAAMPEGSVDIAFVNGAIRTSDQKHMATLLREKAKVVVAFGACAQLGGIPGLANLTTAEEILHDVYGDAATMPQTEYREDGVSLALPELFDQVLPLDRVVPVEYYVPGCPPTPNIIQSAIGALLSGLAPVRGSVLAPDHALCEECPRKATRPVDLAIERLRQVHEQLIDSETCLLAQGVPCLGPATRAGCGTRCIRGNMPCTGCFGPTGRVRDYGGKALSAIASILSADEEQEIGRILEGLPDPAGTLYRYSLPSCSLTRKPEYTHVGRNGKPAESNHH